MSKNRHNWTSGNLPFLPKQYLKFTKVTCNEVKCSPKEISPAANKNEARENLALLWFTFHFLCCMDQLHEHGKQVDAVS